MKFHAVGPIFVGLCLSTGLCQSPPSEILNRGPVQAEFLNRLNVRSLTPGQTIFAQVTLGWDSPDCALRPGSILEAKVETADPHKPHNASKLALSFTGAQCNGTSMTPLNLVLAAVAEAPADWKVMPDSQFRMPVSFSNPHASGMVAGLGAATPGDMYSTRLELIGIIHRFPMTSKVQPGDVLGMKGLKLDIGTGPNRSSVLLGKDHDVSLSAFTQLLLVPASLAFKSGKASLVGAGPLPAADHAVLKPSAAEPANNLEICAPPGCAVDLDVDANALKGQNASSIAIHGLGYAPRSRKILENFDDDDALAWLGSSQLLFAFNLHPLIQRKQGHAGTSRVIRAVLLDAQNRSVVRALDWEIVDGRRYVWQLDGNRVLAHVGNELRVYGPGLEVERSIPLAGPLVFVRIAPGGELLAIATLRERHSQELHAKLRENLSGEPEEDVDVAILDKSFNPIATTTTVSGLMPPTLVNEGQVKLLARSSTGYRLAMSTWQNTETTLARFESRCTPQLSSLAPDLLFLLSCDVGTNDTVYRVLTPDGKLVLRGKAGARQVGFDAAGNGRIFAMKLVNASRDLSFGTDFTGLDLDSAEVRVYRATDGKRLLSVSVNEPVTSRGSYALSPDGAELAVLSGTEIKVFSVPAE